LPFLGFDFFKLLSNDERTEKINMDSVLGVCNHCRLLFKQEF